MGNSTTRNESETRGKHEQIGADPDELTRPKNFRQISAWSLGSLSERLNWSFNSSSRSTHSFSKPRNKSFKQHSSSSRKNSKTSWPIPLTDSIFQSHFKRFSKNDNYIVDKVIAKGAFGIVFKILDKNNPNLEYALKVLSKSKVIQSSSVQQLKDEVDIQKICSHHPFIVKQLDSWQNRRNLHILLEYIPGGELLTQICRFPFELVRLYVAEISLAIDFLHNAGIIYRDVKPENILLTADYHIKLTDFGLSKWLKFGERTKTMCGTLQYMVFQLHMDGRQVDEACSSIFHTVLFHRCLGKFMYTGDATYSIGTVGYSDVDCDFIDFTYVCCTSDSLHRTVKRAITTFSEKLRSNDSTGSGQISLEFFQRKKNRWPFQAECIPWEVWTVRLDLVTIDSEDQRQVYRETVSEVLSDKVFYITEVMNRHDYVPKMPSQNELDLIFDTSYPDIQPYLFKFDFSTSDTPVPSVSNTMKKIFKESLAL